MKEEEKEQTPDELSAEIPDLSAQPRSRSHRKRHIDRENADEGSGDVDAASKPND